MREREKFKMITVHVRDQWSSPTLRQTYHLVLIQLYLIRVKGRESLHVYYIAYKLANYMYKHHRSLFLELQIMTHTVDYE